MHTLCKLMACKLWIINSVLKALKYYCKMNCKVNDLQTFSHVLLMSRICLLEI